MSLTINESSKFLKPQTLKKGDLIIISIGNGIHYGIYDGMKDQNKIFFYHIGGSWWEHPYHDKRDNQDASWLYKKINTPGLGSVDFTNSYGYQRVAPLPEEWCTKRLLEVQKDYKKARNLL